MSTQWRRDYDNARWRRRRKILIAAMDGECVRCGATDNLDFDHIDPATKSFEIGSGLFRPWAVLFAEIDKCQLLCRPCHVAKTIEGGEHAGGHNRIDEHGTEAYYTRTGCRCAECVEAKRLARVRRGERKPDTPPQNIYGGRGRYGTITEHGAGTRGIRGCKCELCMATRAKYARELKRARAASSRA